jgi:tetratricopeptide (TPR) repeat protein
MGHEGQAAALRAARASTGWSQLRLIAEMRRAADSLGVTLPGSESLRTYVKRWESGRVVPASEHRALLRAAYGMTDEQLGLPSAAATLGEQRIALALFDAESAQYFGSLLIEHLRAENLKGPWIAVGLVQNQVTTLASAAREARGTTRRAVIEVAARYHEFYGWLLQDIGQCDSAMIATDRARDLAAELDDQRLNAYLLMRKSNIASDAFDPALAFGLANAALREGQRCLSPKLRAVLLRQQAHAHAGLGDANACASALSDAFDAASRDDSDGMGLAGYCTTEYVAMEAGTCWSQLGEPEKAVSAFEQVSTAWDPAYRRDRGLFLARQAVARAGVEDVERAYRAGMEATVIAAATRSGRTIKELQKLRTRLAPWSSQDHVSSLRQKIVSLTLTREAAR